MSDKQVGHALEHHKFVFRLPKEWWLNQKTNQYEPCTAVVSSTVKINGHFYLNCSIISLAQSKRVAHKLQFPIGHNSDSGFTKRNVCRFLLTRFDVPVTLADIGLEELPGQPCMTAMMVAWVWMTAQRALTPEDCLMDINLLEQDLKSYHQVLCHPHLAPSGLNQLRRKWTGSGAAAASSYTFSVT
eukprot:2625271-Rhodomonas_salina.2